MPQVHKEVWNSQFYLRILQEHCLKAVYHITAKWTHVNRTIHQQYTFFFKKNKPNDILQIPAFESEIRVKSLFSPSHQSNCIKLFYKKNCGFTSLHFFRRKSSFFAFAPTAPLLCLWKSELVVTCNGLDASAASDHVQVQYQGRLLHDSRRSVKCQEVWVGLCSINEGFINIYSNLLLSYTWPLWVGTPTDLLPSYEEHCQRSSPLQK